MPLKPCDFLVSSYSEHCMPVEQCQGTDLLGAYKSSTVLLIRKTSHAQNFLELITECSFGASLLVLELSVRRKGGLDNNPLSSGSK